MADEATPRSTKPRNDLTAEFVRSILDYDTETGDLRWKTRTDVGAWWNGRYAGKRAGRPDKHGHLRLVVNNAAVTAHRLIWFMVTGEWPPDDIDHVNGLRADNRWVNLRQATRAQNLWNMRLKDSNMSGFKGVSKHTQCDRWVAQIRIPGGNRYLGLFHTPEEAHSAYVEAAIKLRGEFARTK